MNKSLQQTLIDAVTPASYQDTLDELTRLCGVAPGFRVCETPIIFSNEFAEKVIGAAEDIVAQLSTPEFMAYSEAAIPADERAPAETPHPSFVLLDFAVAADADGSPTPQMIELQAFPSLFGFTCMLDLAYRENLPIPEDHTSFFNGWSFGKTVEHLRRTIVGSFDPENVVLVEVTPDKQKTAIDFRATEKLLGIRTVGIAEIRKRGRKLFYHFDGTEIPIHRLYDRCLVEDIERAGVTPEWSLRDDLDVTWATHPNWRYRISKHSMPFLNSPYVPESRLLSDYTELPDDLENYILKPLEDWGGHGVDLHLTREHIEQCKNPEETMLERRVTYTPFFHPPAGDTKVEIRVMTAWPDDDPEPRLVNLLTRIFRAEISNVSANNMPWAGGSISYFRRGHVDRH